MKKTWVITILALIGLMLIGLTFYPTESKNNAPETLGNKKESVLKPEMMHLHPQ